MFRNIFLLLGALSSSFLFAQEPAKVDYEGFVQLARSVQVYRDTRLIDFETFQTYAKEDSTIILDCRSKAAYDKVHLKGAIHFNFSDFTEQKLAELIPNKNTRILIYCNNNFRSPLAELANKSPTLALNIPTYINLHGYGYTKLYELSTYLSEEHYSDYFEYDE